MDKLQLGPTSGYAESMVGTRHPLSLHPLTKSRALSFHVFGAACLLLNEPPKASDESKQDSWKSELEMALHVLDGVADRNVVASRAAITIREKLTV